MTKFRRTLFYGVPRSPRRSHPKRDRNAAETWPERGPRQVAGPLASGEAGTPAPGSGPAGSAAAAAAAGYHRKATGQLQETYAGSRRRALAVPPRGPQSSNVEFPCRTLGPWLITYVRSRSGSMGACVRPLSAPPRFSLATPGARA